MGFDTVPSATPSTSTEPFFCVVTADVPSSVATGEANFSLIAATKELGLVGSGSTAWQWRSRRLLLRMQRVHGWRSRITIHAFIHCLFQLTAWGEQHSMRASILCLPVNLLMSWTEWWRGQCTCGSQFGHHNHRTHGLRTALIYWLILSGSFWLSSQSPKFRSNLSYGHIRSRRR